MNAHLFARLVVAHRGFEFLDVCGGQLGPVHLDRQLVELAGERERYLVIVVIHPVTSVDADVE